MKSFFDLSRKTVVESADGLSQWQNKEPVKYVKHLSKFFGQPEELTNKRAIWYNKDGFKRIEILDEFILHTSPLPHYDYVYSYVDIKVPHELSDDLAMSSESILIDHLKGEVGGRCASLSANAATIQYVIDVVEGNVKPSKAEYEKRIKAMHAMFDSGKTYKLDWWPDETKDTDPNNKYYKEEIYMKLFFELREKHLTPAEMKKREEVAKAMSRDNPNMPMGKKMAIATATAKKVAEAKDPGEYDYEGDMAKNNLKTICRASGEMADMLDENTNLPEWVQSKITLAEDYISSAYNYMMSEAEEMDEGTEDVSSVGSRSLARIANTVGHPGAAAAKNELARRRMKNEETKLNEISKGTLGKYIKLAGHDREQRLKSADKLANVGHNIKSNDPEHANKLFTKAGREFEKAANRKAGINKAVNKLVGEEVELGEAKPGLYANINAKRKRIEAGSGERMRKPGSKGAPSTSDFKDAAKTAIRKHKTFTEASEDYVYKTQSAARKAFKENDRMRRSEGGAKYSIDDAEEAFADMVSYWIKDKYVPKTASNWTLY